MVSFDQLIKKIKSNNSNADLKKIEKAYNFAKKSHEGQRRKSGESYIYHPVEVAYNLANFKFNTDTFVAALLHDTIEDTSVKPETIKEIIRKEFGAEVEKLVSGVTKLSKIEFKKHLDWYPIENLRKMFLAMAQDLRVVLIKLFDRYHNLKTLKSLTREQQRRIAQETIEIYAPLAYRLGIGELRGQLEDLAFPYLLPKEYKEISKIAAEEIEKRTAYIEKSRHELEKVLKDAKINYLNVHGRAKHLYSLYRKLQKYNNNINNVYDLLALRVIVGTVSDCYKTLGIIHQHWKPLLGRIKDFIAVPKTNGYQSLHTTIITHDGKIIEIQIRTQKMHEEAEYGLAASWYYQESGKPTKGSFVPQKLSWINQLIEWQNEVQDSKKFAESLKIDFFKDRIFIFTPKGDLLDLPDGSTPIDFAYQIHTDIGNHCYGVIVNDKFIPLDHKLKNGDVVDILTRPSSHPVHDWLSFVNTDFAKSRIKNWFKKQDRLKNLDYGKNLLNEELYKLKQEKITKIDKKRINLLLDKFSYKTFDDLLIAIGYGDINIQQVIRTLYKEEDFFVPQQRKFVFFGKPTFKLRAIIENEEGILTNIAKCCKPQLKDKIKAYITRSSGASIHKTSCPELKKLAKKDRGRILNAYWEENGGPIYLSNIEIQSLDRVGLLHDITEKIKNSKISIANLKIAKQSNDIASINLNLELKNVDQLINLIKRLEKIKGVVKVIKK